MLVMVDATPFVARSGKVGLRGGAARQHRRLNDQAGIDDRCLGRRRRGQRNRRASEPLRLPALRHDGDDRRDRGADCAGQRGAVRGGLVGGEVEGEVMSTARSTKFPNWCIKSKIILRRS